MIQESKNLFIVVGIAPTLTLRYRGNERRLFPAIIAVWWYQPLQTTSSHIFPFRDVPWNVLNRQQTVSCPQSPTRPKFHSLSLRKSNGSLQLTGTRDITQVHTTHSRLHPYYLPLRFTKQKDWLSRNQSINVRCYQTLRRSRLYVLSLS